MRFCLSRAFKVGLAAALCCLAGLAQADIFKLAGGGEVRGELQNRDQSPRKFYSVRSAAGGDIKLDAAQVVKVLPQNSAAMEFDRMRPDYPDTIEGNWKLAEWCRSENLLGQRKQLLERILQVDSGHAEARRALGYRQVRGQWVTRDDLMQENGYVRYKGRWMLPQEVELIEQEHKNELAEKEWFSKIKRWNSWLGTTKSAVAENGFRALKDPMAVKALGEFIKRTDDRELKLLYLTSIGNVLEATGAANALDTAAMLAVDDSDGEIRASALEMIDPKKHRQATSFFVQRLRSKDNLQVNRAGVALGHMQDPSSVGPLINALITSHKFQVTKGTQPGQMSSSFGGSGAGGFSFGEAKPEIITQQLENPDVLAALVSITRSVSFDYDVAAWKYWYASTKKPATLDARRDDKQDK